MDSIDYYKSQISDDEVIKALIKESKARNEALKEKTRMRPNLNFFQRTVTNLVTSNKRVNTTKELLYKEKEDSSYKIRAKVKTLDTKEITTDKIDFVKGKSESVESTQSFNPVSRVEETYRENLTKYFVPAVERKTKNESAKTYKFGVNNKVRSKSIVFNLNFGDKRHTKLTTDSKVSSSSFAETVCVDITTEKETNDVIQISDSESD